MSQAAAERGQVEELLELAQEAGGIGIFEWEVPTGHMALSQTFRSLYSLDSFDGRFESWMRCIFREDQPRISNLIETAFAEHTHSIHAEFRIVGVGGLRWMEGRARIFYDREGRPLRVVGVTVDITARKRADVQLRAFTETLEEAVRERTRELEEQHEARRRAEESLRQAQKMEVVGQLTGGIAHDFNNLLTVIIGGLDVIGRHAASLDPAPAVARILRARDMASQGAQRAALLTSRLLAFSRRQPLDPKPVDVNRLVAGMSDFLRRTLAETIALSTVLADGLWPSYADPNQLENAVLNLALNARDAMPDGGRLTIETGNARLDSAYVGQLAEPVDPGDYVLIAVSDTGIGMDPPLLEKVFEPFFTTKEVGKGTGLGLSQVYGFVRQSAGHVKIYSEPGQGTSVKIYLPRHAGKDKISERDIRTVAATQGGGERILVVEDDPAVRAHTVDVLTELGYQVLQAANGAEAIEILQADIAIDLLFTDIVMPGGINGRQLADVAVRERPGLKVLFTTGYARNAIVHQGRLDSDVRMIAKPFTVDALGEAVRAAVDGRE